MSSLDREPQIPSDPLGPRADRGEIRRIYVTCGTSVLVGRYAPGNCGDAIESEFTFEAATGAATRPKWRERRRECRARTCSGIPPDGSPKWLDPQRILRHASRRSDRRLSPWWRDSLSLIRFLLTVKSQPVSK